MISRRDFLKLSGAGTLSLFLASRGKFILKAQAQIPGGTLDPFDVPKFVTPLLIPPVMPRAGTIRMKGGKQADYYEISMKQIPPADSAGWSSTNTRLGIWRGGWIREKPTSDSQRAFAHH